MICGSHCVLNSLRTSVRTINQKVSCEMRTHHLSFLNLNVDTRDMHQSEGRNRASHRSSRVYSVFSGEICPVTGCRNDVALRLWLQDRGRWKIQRMGQRKGRHFVIKSILIIPPNEAFLHLNLAGVVVSTERLAMNVSVKRNGGPAALNWEPQLISL